jgi:hypothetical protein
MFYSLIFLTTWIVILVLFHKYTHKYINLLYLTFLAFAVGSYLSFINPGFYTLPLSRKENIIFHGWHRFIIIDVAIHFLFFCFVYYFYYDFYKTGKTVSGRRISNNTICAICIVILYLSILSYNCVTKIYKIGLVELVIVSIISSILYFSL